MPNNQNQALRILNLGVDEMFEDLTYNVAYDVILKKLKDNGMDDGILKQAIDSGITIMFSSALMLYIQKQEAVIQKILGLSVAALGVVLGGVRDKAKQLFKKFSKGRKLSMFSRIFGDTQNDNATLANVVANVTQSAFSAQQSSNQFYNRADGVMQQKKLIMHSKDQQLNYAKAKAETFNQTLMFKLLTSKFTATDKDILRKITGAESIDIEQINKVADFMWVKDDKGDIIGLSEAFMQMLNGLGYFYNKSKGGNP